MLRSIHINDIHCFVDFSYQPSQFDLLAGRCGTGRTSLLQLLGNLRHMLLVASDPLKVWDSFPLKTCTKWRPRAVQTVVLELVAHESRFTYRLEIAQGSDEMDTRVAREELLCDDESLFSYKRDEERWKGHHDDDDLDDPAYYEFLREGKSSMLAPHLDQPTDERLQWFRAWWAALWIITLGDDDFWFSDGEVSSPDGSFCRFAPWYRFLLRTEPDHVAAFHAECARVLDGFLELAFAEDEHGDSTLHAIFANPTGGDPVKYDFTYLAKEERCLIQMYSIMHFVLRSHRVVMIDAPNAAIPLEDVRRWLERVQERAAESSRQLMLVINEPGLLGDPTAGRVCRFERPNRGATVVTVA